VKSLIVGDLNPHGRTCQRKRAIEELGHGVSAHSLVAVDLVEDGENGFILRFGDLAALTIAMQRMIADLTACRYIGRRSVDVISTWSYQQCVEVIMYAPRSMDFSS
jgi:hypothetical protein